MTRSEVQKSLTQFDWWTNSWVKTYSGDVTHTKITDRLLYLVDRPKSGLFLGAFGACALSTNGANLKNAAQRSHVVVTEGSGGDVHDAISFQQILCLPEKVRVEVTFYCPDVTSLMAHLQRHLVKALEVTAANRMDILVYWPNGEIDNLAVMDILRERLCEPMKYGGAEDVHSCFLNGLPFARYQLSIQEIKDQLPMPE